MKDSLEFEFGNVTGYTAACLIFMYFAYGFTIPNGIIALSVAIILSIKPANTLQERKSGIIVGSLLGIIPLVLWLRNYELVIIVIFVIAALGALVFLASHHRQERLQNIATLFYGIIAYSFVSSAGNSIILFSGLIFWTLAATLILTLLVTRVNKKVRAHRRARIQR